MTKSQLPKPFLHNRSHDKQTLTAVRATAESLITKTTHTACVPIQLVVSILFRYTVFCILLSFALTDWYTVTYPTSFRCTCGWPYTNTLFSFVPVIYKCVLELSSSFKFYRHCIGHKSLQPNELWVLHIMRLYICPRLYVMVWLTNFRGGHISWTWSWFGLHVLKWIHML